MSYNTFEKLKECARQLNCLGLVKFADQLNRWIDYTTGMNTSISNAELMSKNYTRLWIDIKMNNAIYHSDVRKVLSLTKQLLSVCEEAPSHIIHSIEIALDKLKESEQDPEESTTLIAYTNTTGSDQENVTLAGYASTSAYDKSGQAIPYDATKTYTVAEYGALGSWQSNNDTFSLVQNVNDNSLEIRNNMSGDQTVAAVKYDVEENPTVEIWYTQEGGSLENTVEIAAGKSCPMFAADGSAANYNTLYQGSKDIVAWHDGNSWHSNTKSSRFYIASANVTVMVNGTSAPCRCSAVLTAVIGSNHQGLTGFVSAPGRDYATSSASWMTLRTGDRQAIPYDATKNYVILGTYLKDGTSATGVLDGGITKNGANQLQVRQKANTTLCYVKYKIKDASKFYASSDKQPRSVPAGSSSVPYLDNGNLARWSPGYTYIIKALLLSTGEVYTTEPFGTLTNSETGYVFYNAPNSFTRNLIAIFYEAVKT